jgi:hypothetical protein
VVAPTSFLISFGITPHAVLIALDFAGEITERGHEGGMKEDTGIAGMW